MAFESLTALFAKIPDLPLRLILLPFTLVRGILSLVVALIPVSDKRETKKLAAVKARRARRQLQEKDRDEKKHKKQHRKWAKQKARRQLQEDLDIYCNLRMHIRNPAASPPYLSSSDVGKIRRKTRQIPDVDDWCSTLCQSFVTGFHVDFTRPDAVDVLFRLYKPKVDKERNAAIHLLCEYSRMLGAEPSDEIILSWKENWDENLLRECLRGILNRERKGRGYPPL